MEIYENLSLENLTNEEWKDVVGYEGLYKVSNLGRVKSLFNSHGQYREKVLKQFFRTNKKDYLVVGLYKKGKLKICLVHRLVAQAFIQNPNNYPIINHKDENPSNNCVYNLEWCDTKYNLNYGTCIKRRVENMDYKALAEKFSKKVYQYTKDGTLVAIYHSTKEAKRNGFDNSTVSKCCLGKLKTHKGYIWSYKELV